MRLVFDESNIHSTLDTQTNAIKNVLFLVLASKISTYSLVPGVLLIPLRIASKLSMTKS